MSDPRRWNSACLTLEGGNSACLTLVGWSATFTWKNGRLGFTRIPGFVPLQKYCSPIRLQYSSGSSGCYATLSRARAVELSCLPFEQLCPRRILDSHTKFLMNTRLRRGHVH